MTPPPTGKKTFLIVDDSAPIRQLVTFTLKDGGHDVVAAASGKEALEKLTAGAVDMVITDLNMPEMDGIALITQIRMRAAHRFTPIVMLTTESQEDKKAAGRQAGASAWIVKPFSPEQLMETIKKFVK